MTCDEVDISWIFQPCDSSSRADDLFGGSSGIVRYFNILSFNLLAGGVCDNEQCVIFIEGLYNFPHPGKVASYSVTLFTAIAVPSFQVSERAKSRVGSLVKNKIRTQVINSSIIHP